MKSRTVEQITRDIERTFRRHARTARIPGMCEDRAEWYRRMAKEEARCKRWTEVKL